MSDSVRIDTTQNVRLSFELATLGDRIAAGIIDLAIILGYIFILAYLIGLDILPDSTAFFVVFLMPVIFYHLLFETLNNGRSIGKMALKTRVVKMDGTEPGIGDFAIRWLLGLLEFNVGSGSLAVVVLLLNGKGQRLGDMVANTTVAKQKKRVTLEDTLFEEVSEDYTVKYNNVNQLDDVDIETIKAVVASFEKTYSASTITLMHKTREVIRQKLGINVIEGNDRDFLMQVVKDFNFVTGRVDD
jgi:uncharacterized RDD family membrane protein YckC